MSDSATTDATEKVVALKLTARTGNEQAIRLFQNLLDMAKAGEVLEAMVLTVEPGGQISHHFTTSDNLLAQLGAAHRMADAINRRMSRALEPN